MDPLLHQLPSTHHLWVRSPLSFVTGPASNPVTGADEHKVTNAIVIKPPPGLLDGRMVTVIEAALEDTAGLPGRRPHDLGFFDRSGQRFLAQDMFAVPHRGDADGSVKMRRRRHDKGI
jgi:hypothetical protein